MIKHGHAGTPTHQAWLDMLRRCYNPKFPNFIRWGGRGITVCDRWRVQIDKHPFLYFWEDMGERPGKKYSLDRIDNNGDYTPENCKWATRSQQLNNQERSHIIEFQGKSHTVSEWATKLNINRSTLFHRIRAGWSVADLLTITESQAGKRKNTDHIITFNGKSQNITDWAKELHIDPMTLFARINTHKWSIEKALTTPVNYNLSRHLKSPTRHNTRHGDPFSREPDLM